MSNSYQLIFSGISNQDCSNCVSALGTNTITVTDVGPIPGFHWQGIINSPLCGGTQVAVDLYYDQTTNGELLPAESIIKISTNTGTGGSWVPLTLAYVASGAPYPGQTYGLINSSPVNTSCNWPGSLTLIKGTWTQPDSYNPQFPNPGNCTGWTNASYVAVADGAYATETGGNVDCLTVNGFGFQLPPNAQIVGIQFGVVRHQSSGGTIQDYQLYLTKDGVTNVGSNQACIGYNWQQNTDETVIYGGQDYLFNSTWTPAEINSPNFGLRYIVNGTGTAYIDAIDIDVWYRLPVPGSGSGGPNATCITETPQTVIQTISENTAWTSLTGSSSNLATYGDTPASCSLVTHPSDIITASNFGFSIPSNATITGVTVSILRGIQGSDPEPTPGIVDLQVQLTSNGSTTLGQNKADTTNPWSVGEMTWKEYGGSSDLWSATLTPAIVNSSTFGVFFACKLQTGATAQTANLDMIEVTVCYTINGQSGSGSGSGRNGSGSGSGTGGPVNAVGTAHGTSTANGVGRSLFASRFTANGTSTALA